MFRKTVPPASSSRRRGAFRPRRGGALANGARRRARARHATGTRARRKSDKRHTLEYVVAAVRRYDHTIRSYDTIWSRYEKTKSSASYRSCAVVLTEQFAAQGRPGVASVHPRRRAAPPSPSSRGRGSRDAKARFGEFTSLLLRPFAQPAGTNDASRRDLSADAQGSPTRRSRMLLVAGTLGSRERTKTPADRPVSNSRAGERPAP